MSSEVYEAKPIEPERDQDHGSKTTTLPQAFQGPDLRVQVPPNCDLTLGMVCIEKAEPNRTVWQMTADERFANPVGILQGGFLAAFADSAMGATALRWAQSAEGGDLGKVFSANAEMKVSFFTPVSTGSTITCEARVVSGGSRTVFLEAEVRDRTGRPLAKASSTYLLRPRTRP